MLVKYVDSTRLGICPCAVVMDNGVIEINTSVWDKYSNWEKNFFLYHEAGHYNRQTNDETDADAYALAKMYDGTAESLQKSLATLQHLNVPNYRILSLKKLIEKYKSMKHSKLNLINNVTGEPVNETPVATTNEAAVSPVQHKNLIIATTENKALGFTFGNWYVSIDTVLLLATLVFTILMYKHSK